MHSTSPDLSRSAEHARLDGALQGPCPEDLTLHDIDRGTPMLPSKDKKRLLDLFDGTDTTQGWLNYSLAARP